MSKLDLNKYNVGDVLLVNLVSNSNNSSYKAYIGILDDFKNKNSLSVPVSQGTLKYIDINLGEKGSETFEISEQEMAENIGIFPNKDYKVFSGKDEIGDEITDKIGNSNTLDRILRQINNYYFREEKVIPMTSFQKRSRHF